MSSALTKVLVICDMVNLKVVSEHMSRLAVVGSLVALAHEGGISCCCFRAKDTLEGG